jgi:retinol-binding protein 3
VVTQNQTIMRLISSFCLFILFAVCSNFAYSQGFDKTAIVNELADLMNENYVFPEKGKAMHDLIKSNLEQGEYDGISDETAFAERLDADLHSIANDGHIRVNYDPTRIEKIRGGVGMGGRTAPQNYGFETVEIKDGIGYLDLRMFYNLRHAREVAQQSMDKLIDAEAIIFDLRKNGGGSPAMIRFICSYLFEESVHLNSFYWRPQERHSETWTNPDFAKVRKPDIPVYVLTSSQTYSAAEEFTYDLKHLKRATIIGETTGGGAHPGGPMIINDDFFVNVPQGRAINPVTKTNWEVVGVVPHIAVPANLALDKAQELAKKALLENN